MLKHKYITMQKDTNLLRLISLQKFINAIFFVFLADINMNGYDSSKYSYILKRAVSYSFYSQIN